MVIINPSFATQPAAVNRPAGPAPVLAIDRVLTAVVIGQRAEHLYELASGNLKMMAESQTALRHGEKLLLQVTGKDQQQRPQLQILKPDTGLINEQLRSSLPQQQSVNQLIANLGKLINMPQQQQLAALGKEFIEAIASKPQASDPAGLRQAILQSGLFMESQLAKGDAPTRDLKRALLRLNQRLNQQLHNIEQAPKSDNSSKNASLAREYAPQTRIAPLLSEYSAAPSAENYPKNRDHSTNRTELPGQLSPQHRQTPTLSDADSNLEILRQLLRDVRGTLTRQESHQLLHLQQNDKTQYMIELPVRSNDGIDVWQLHFHKFDKTDREQANPQQQSTKEEPQHNWTISLSFDLPELGPIRARITQNPELKILFNAGNSATTALITSKRHELEQTLAAQGVSTQSIECHNSPITIASSELFSQSLVETQA